MRLFSRLSLLVTVLLLLLAPAAAWCKDPDLLFDEGHGQRFVMEKEGDLELSTLAKVFTDAGFTPAPTREPLNDVTLAHARALVISGLFTPLSPQEVASIGRFLERGGRLAIMLHIGQPVAELLHSLNVDVSNYVLSEQENIIGDDPKNFRVTRFVNHPLTAGLDHFSLHGGWALMNLDDSARIVASTSPRAWVDLDGNRKLSPGDVVQSFGVVVAGTRGNGRFAVFGDDAIFQNRFMDEANRQLALDLASWLH